MNDNRLNVKNSFARKKQETDDIQYKVLLMQTTQMIWRFLKIHNFSIKSQASEISRPVHIY